MESFDILKEQNEKIDLKREINKYLRRWYWFALSVMVFLAAATIYLRYAEKQYLSKTTLKFQQSKQGAATASALSDLKALGMGVSGDGELITETAVIVSKPILEKVVHNLNLQVKVYSVGKVKESDLYNNPPFTVKLYVMNPKFNGGSYTLDVVGNNSFKISGLKENFRFGIPYEFPFGKAVFHATPGLKLDDEYRVDILNIEQAVNSLESTISVVIPEDKGYIMELSRVGVVPKKSEDILNEISRQYNIDGINDKNQEALSTQEFIRKRIDIITNDLLGVESQKESFKRQNEIADLETQAQLSLQNASENTRQIVTMSTQLDLINSLNVAAAGSGDKLLPSNLGLPASTEALIAQYNDLVLTRNRTLKQATNANPAVVEMNKEIASLKGVIRKNLSDTRNTLAQNIGNLQQQVIIDKGKIARVPGQEKIARGIDRELNLKEQLYLFLLQKREENEITLAVTAPKAKVVNPAFTVGQVKPKSQVVMLGAGILGLLLPFLFLYSKFALDTKIHSREDLTNKIKDATVLTEIPLHEEENELIGPNDFSVYAESFRILSSNLKFLLKTKGIEKGGVLVITSSIKGEGKTTVSMNTAMALSGKNKVILIGADLRNPQIQRYFTSYSSQGLSDYLISETDDHTPFITTSHFSKNLDVLVSGTTAPNPNDLLDMEKFGELIEKLRIEYDYVLIDSAPVMLVSDSIHLVEHADVVLYVTRADHTEKDMLDFASNFGKENQIKTLAFVLNGVHKENTRYGKKYGYGYYNEKPETGWKKWLGKF